MDRTQITGLVLAGGRGSRMGGVDKGLQLHHGLPLAQHALERIAPQVGARMISANRNLDAYRAMGVPVWPDAVPDYAGPLAGLLAGLQHADTPWVVTVPCDSPDFPDDLVERLAAAIVRDNADIAMPVTQRDGKPQVQPVFCLLKTSLAADLAAYIAAGERKFEFWTDRHRRVDVPFEDAEAFFNANTQAELASLQKPRSHAGP
jgi:molybdenum cofactor guanylyltransferase